MSRMLYGVRMKLVMRWFRLFVICRRTSSRKPINSSQHYGNWK